MRWLIGIVVALVLLMGWQIASAAVAINALVTAANSRDTATVLRYTDVGALRRSLTDQVLAVYSTQQPVGQKRTIDRVLTSALGPTVVDAYVGTLLTPENIARALRENSFGSGSVSSDRAGLEYVSFSNAGEAISRGRIVQPMEIAIRTSSPSDEYAGVRLQSNLFGWKLAGIDLPRRALLDAVASIRNGS